MALAVQLPAAITPGALPGIAGQAPAATTAGGGFAALLAVAGEAGTTAAGAGAAITTPVVPAAPVDGDDTTSIEVQPDAAAMADSAGSLALAAFTAAPHAAMPPQVQDNVPASSDPAPAENHTVVANGLSTAGPANTMSLANGTFPPIPEWTQPMAWRQEQAQTAPGNIVVPTENTAVSEPQLGGQTHKLTIPNPPAPATPPVEASATSALADSSAVAFTPELQAASNAAPRRVPNVSQPRTSAAVNFVLPSDTEAQGIRSAISIETPGVVRFDGNAPVINPANTAVATAAATVPADTGEAVAGAQPVPELTFVAGTQGTASQPAAPVAIPVAEAVPGTAEASVASVDAVTPGLQPTDDLESIADRDSDDAASTATAEATGDAVAPGFVAPPTSAREGNASSDRQGSRQNDSQRITEVRGESSPISATTDAAAQVATPSPVQQPAAPAAPERVQASAEATAPQFDQPVEQVAQAVLDNLETGSGEARLHLQPRELGDVVIHIRTHGDRIEVNVQADRSEAVAVLRDQANELAGLLGDRGLNLADLNVGLSPQQGRQWATPDQQPNNHRDGASAFDSILAPDSVDPNRAHRQLRAAYNPDGAHIYRV